ncbi:MAG: zeta toxin family protein [Muribaculaceae bacterium]|nr:zeta toxin family protein [Muribaculaceae bacterium]
MNEHRPEMIVIAGPNGSGKTTITTQFLHHEWAEGTLYINPDNVAKDVFGDWNSAQSVLKAAEYCSNLRESCLRVGKSFVFETVFSSQEKIDFIIRAKEHGFFIRFFFVGTSTPMINAARIAKRVIEGGHDVPITKIVSRYSKSLSNCRLVAPIVDRLYVYDNSVDGHMAQIQYRLSNGRLIKQYVDEVLPWAAKILEPGQNRDNNDK